MLLVRWSLMPWGGVIMDPAGSLSLDSGRTGLG
jgi:hypothetical protein